MLSKEIFKQLISASRTIEKAEEGDEKLGAFSLLPGKWGNSPCLNGRGWNLIALPFIATAPANNLNYRLLMNQYNEELEFDLVDKGVPNRGISKMGGVNTDQFIVTLDYQQSITQIAADDFPKSGLAGGPKLPIHHEPGLFLLMTNEVTKDYEIARSASIPHGNSVLALGRVKVYEGAPDIPEANALPIGVSQDINSKYLAPYRHFQDNPFQGLFQPLDANKLLREANDGVAIARTTELHFDTRFATGGIHNIPFIERQADASDMVATFWIQELKEKDAFGDPKLRIQYSQTVFLDFFPSREPTPSDKIIWPHISINTMDKIS